MDIIEQACRGLDHAHRNGVVHRDVKPGNLLLSADGLVKLADFGIARATEQSSITQVGSVLGTAAYLAPEQARGEEAGPAADMYALAVVTYQMLAGRLPYEATSLSELTLKQQREMPPPLDVVNPNVPATLAHAVARGLALDAAGRYTSALEMGAGPARRRSRHRAPARRRRGQRHRGDADALARRGRDGRDPADRPRAIPTPPSSARASARSSPSAAPAARLPPQARRAGAPSASAAPVAGSSPSSSSPGSSPPAASSPRTR